MDWNQVEGNWKQVKGKVKEQWGKLTDDDLDQINGKREQLEGKLQERYGYAKDQTKKEVDDCGMARAGLVNLQGPASAGLFFRCSRTKVQDRTAASRDCRGWMVRPPYLRALSIHALQGCAHCRRLWAMATQRVPCDRSAPDSRQRDDRSDAGALCGMFRAVCCTSGET